MELLIKEERKNHYNEQIDTIMEEIVVNINRSIHVEKRKKIKITDNYNIFRFLSNLAWLLF